MTPNLDTQITFIEAQIELHRSSPIYVVAGEQYERLPEIRDEQLATLKGVLDTLLLVKFNQPVFREALNHSTDFILVRFDCPKYPQCDTPVETICWECPGKSRSLRYLLEGEADA